MLVRELTELLRLALELATGTEADYEATSELHHRLILDTIKRTADKRVGAYVVKCIERSSVSVILNRLVTTNYDYYSCSWLRCVCLCYIRYSYHINSGRCGLTVERSLAVLKVAGSNLGRSASR